MPGPLEYIRVERIFMFGRVEEIFGSEINNSFFLSGMIVKVAIIKRGVLLFQQINRCYTLVQLLSNTFI